MPDVSTATNRAPVRGLRIGIVEDAPEIVTILDYNLAAAGYQVEVMECGDRAVEQLQEQPPDLLILDWMLPGVSGIELLRRLRRWPNTQKLPVIVLTARSAEKDLVRALETGADDFMTKPFSPKELVARVGALLRRRAPDKVSPILVRGDIELDRECRRVRRRGKIVELGPTDYRLLEMFLVNPGRVIDRQEILDLVWGTDTHIDDRTIDVYVGRLRKALLGAWRSDPIKTVRTAGYRFDER
jgi:two-component system, OmpR family, phosphate regulon response regulator PhoB